MSWGSLSRCSIQLVGVHIGGLNNHESLLSEVILCHKESLTLCSRKCLNRFWIEFVLSHRVGPLTLAFIQFSADEPDWKLWLLLRLTHARAHTHMHTLSLHNSGHTGRAVSLSVSLSNSLLACWLSCTVKLKSCLSLQETLRSLLHTHYPHKTHGIHTSSLFLFSSPCLFSACTNTQICPRRQQMLLLFSCNEQARTNKFFTLYTHCKLSINVASALFWH